LRCEGWRRSATHWNGGGSYHECGTQRGLTDAADRRRCVVVNSSSAGNSATGGSGGWFEALGRFP
jgi:hypothetical protein